MYSNVMLADLLEAADEPHPDFALVRERNERVHDYIESFVDQVPRNDNEAREAFDLAAELVPGVEPVRALTRLAGRTTRALIALRRLEREARSEQDLSPLQREERVLRSLIAYMARPVLLSE